MKILFFIPLFFLISQAFGQANPPAGAEYKYLRDGNGQQKRIVYFVASKDYYPCGGPEEPRYKVRPGERLLNKDCDCSADGVPPVGAAASYGNIQFDFDSSVLRTSSYPVLDATSANLRESNATVEIEGFASSEGTAAHNLRLSKDRANSVKTYLVNSGVSAHKIKVKANGETKPIADNSTEEGRVLNRRVEINKP